MTKFMDAYEYFASVVDNFNIVALEKPYRPTSSRDWYGALALPEDHFEYEYV